MVTSQQPSKRKVFIQVRPMNAVGRDLDPAQLAPRRTGKPRIRRHWETNLAPALHHDYDLTVPENG
jgi:hypothetical protein